MAQSSLASHLFHFTHFHLGIEIFDVDNYSTTYEGSRSLENRLPAYIRDGEVYGQEILRVYIIIIITVLGTNHPESSLWNVICRHDFFKALTFPKHSKF